MFHEKGIVNETLAIDVFVTYFCKFNSIPLISFKNYRFPLSLFRITD